MRFRGKIVDIACIQNFTRVVATIAKLTKKSCIFRLTTDKLFFILSEQAGNGGVSIWCELAQSHFFNEYNMDGVSEDSNEIYLDVIPDNLLRCMKAAQNAKSVKLKLTKKHTPCLTFEVELPSQMSSSRVVVHDVPVQVIPTRLWEEYDEPPMPDFDISIYMPDLKILRNVVDRMKNLSNFVVISANQLGEMRLQVETEMATVATHFKNLEHPTWRDQSQSEHRTQRLEPAEFADARIDIRKFAQFLLGQQVNPMKVICNIVDQRIAHFFLLHEDLSLQYFMPAVSR